MRYWRRWVYSRILYFPKNNAAAGIYVYVAAFIPFVTDSLAICLATFALVCGTIIAQGLLMHNISPWSWGFGALFTLIVGGTNLFSAQRMRANSKLRMAHEEIEQLAKLAERERIARDLHDVLGHTLSVIVLKSELAGRLFARDPERAAREIADVEMISRKALSEVREAIRGYRAEGLAAEIKRAHGTLDAAGVTLGIRREAAGAESGCRNGDVAGGARSGHEYRAARAREPMFDAHLGTERTYFAGR